MSGGGGEDFYKFPTTCRVEIFEKLRKPLII